MKKLDEYALNKAGWKLIQHLDEIKNDPLGCKPALREIIETYLKVAENNKNSD